MRNLLFVFIGGGIGAGLRYLISLIPIKTGYPVLTLLTNLAGAVFIGFIVGAFGYKKLSSSQSLFLKTGVCGGFTTFSTFSLESWQLIEKGACGAAAGYMTVSLAGGIVGVVVGRCLASAVFKKQA